MYCVCLAIYLGVYITVEKLLRLYKVFQCMNLNVSKVC